VKFKDCHIHGACPFSFTEESDQVQNYGCLPTPYEIINMRQEHGKTWACHDDITKPCKGAILYMKKKGLDYHVIDPVLVTERDDWGVYVR
jgi:hypothetical protein